MIIPDDVIQIDLHGVVLQLEMIVDGHEFQRRGVQAEMIRLQGGFPGRNLAEQFPGAPVGDDCQALGNRCPHASGVIEVMMRNDRFRHRLSRNHGPGCFDQCERPGLVHRHLEHRQMVGEFQKNGVVAPVTVEPPHTRGQPVRPRPPVQTRHLEVKTVPTGVRPDRQSVRPRYSC